MKESTIILSGTSKNNDVPDCIKILPIGYVSSEKGNFIVDQESYDMIKNCMQKRDIDIVVDYEHQTLDNIQAPASGWIKGLILKEDGIFANVEWTDRAKNYIKNKEYRYLSPVVMVRKSDNRVTQIHSVALTSTPAIKGMTAIANSLKVCIDNKNTSPDETKNEVLRMLKLTNEDYEKYKGSM